MKIAKISSKFLFGFGIGIAVVLSAITFAPNESSAAMLSRQLEIGMSGSDVVALQTYLAADRTIYPEGLVTGYFGSLTESAVKRFQARFGLPQVGRVGPLTIAAIGDLSDTTRTVGIDNSAPIISGISESKTRSSATISWNTNEPSSALVYYDTAALRLKEADANNGISISGIPELVHTNLTNSHSATISGLRSNTTYNYLVYARDANGNVSITLPNSIKTD